MLYQLPTGKVISLTIEEYLALTDQDIQFLVSINAGDYANSPWVGSSIKPNAYKNKDYVTNEIDYTDPDEDKSHGDNPNTDTIYLDELPEIPDPDSLDQ
jgi:hypothetical protein